MSVLDIAAGVLVLGGSALALTAAIGVVRFPDTLSRMHAATKPQVLGLLLVLGGRGDPTARPRRRRHGDPDRTCSPSSPRRWWPIASGNWPTASRASGTTC